MADENKWLRRSEIALIVSQVFVVLSLAYWLIAEVTK